MGFAGGWTVAAKLCDSCESSAASLFCCSDMAFLCFGCDTRIHRMDTKFPVRHGRVWMCEVCEHAPAAVTCRADAAALCVACDADIHSANTLASRHDRVPVEPFFDMAEESMARSASLSFLLPTAKSEVCGGACKQDEPEAVSWLLPNLNDGDLKVVEEADVKVAPTVVDNHGLFMNEMESLLGFEFETGGMDRFHNAAMDSLVPVQTKQVPALANPVVNNNRPPENFFDIGLCRSKLSSFGHISQSLSHSVSTSSLDIGVVPECALSNNSTDPSLTNTATSFGCQPTQLCGVDREARVLRYREKRKNRKFEKTIRYASRKAYAETRPRIKGRFAKRSVTEIEMESDVDNYFYPSSAFMADTHYGVVPTF